MYEGQNKGARRVSDTDSFIEEVTEEVRRDRMFAWVKRYGWMAIAAVLLIVGAAAFNEYSKAQATAKAQAFGDSVLQALDLDAPSERAEALMAINAEGTPESAQSLLALLSAKEWVEADREDDAITLLQAVSDDAEVPLVYRQVASFKLLALQASDLSIQERSLGYQALIGGNPQLRVLAEEQLALLDVEQGNTKEAIAAFNAIVQDTEATAGQKRRASQLIVALGGDLVSTNGE